MFDFDRYEWRYGWPDHRFKSVWSGFSPEFDLVWDVTHRMWFGIWPGRFETGPKSGRQTVRIFDTVRRFMTSTLFVP